MRSKESSVLAVLLAITLVAGVLAASEVTQAEPAQANFWASSAHDPDRVLGFGFAPDTVVTMTVDSGAGAVPVSDPPTTRPDGSFDYRDRPGFDLTSGDILEVSDGAVTKSLTLVGLSVDSLDYDADTASGSSDQIDGTPVQVSALDEGFVDTVATTVASGTWSAAFAIDFTEDMGAFAAINDPDGDATVDAIEIEPPPNPQMSVETPNQVWAHGDGWIAGRTVTITVDDDHDLANGSLYSTTAVVEAWGPEPWEVGWNVETGGFEILPAHVVTADDGVDIVRTLDVVDVQVTEVNEANDTISGTAPANAWVQGHANDGTNTADRRVQAAADGTFTIDFGNPGLDEWEQAVLDIRPGVGGAAQVFEDDGDSTHRGWRVAEPYIGVNVIHDELWAIDWPVGALLTFTVEDGGAVVAEDTMTVVATSWGQTEAGYRFWGDFDVQAGPGHHGDRRFAHQGAARSAPSR